MDDNVSKLADDLCLVLGGLNSISKRAKELGIDMDIQCFTHSHIGEGTIADYYEGQLTRTTRDIDIKVYAKPQG